MLRDGRLYDLRVKAAFDGAAGDELITEAAKTHLEWTMENWSGAARASERLLVRLVLTLIGFGLVYSSKTDSIEILGMKIEDLRTIRFALSALYAFQLWQLAQLVTHALVLGGVAVSIHRAVYPNAAEAHLDAVMVPYGMSFSIRRAPNRLVIDPASRTFRFADYLTLLTFYVGMVVALAAGIAVICAVFDRSALGMGAALTSASLVTLALGHIVIFAMRVRAGMRVVRP